MSAPLKPHWKQPSHPAIQEVLVGTNQDHEFTTKSISRVDLPPFALFAPLSSPPVTPAAAATYATVQVGRHQHINLNSDLLYINHSCEPSLIFDTASRNVWVGPKGLRVGDELTFFYPSTEWDMAQPFDCLCGTPSCRGRISGARTMTRDQLAGLWLNGHIWELLKEQEEEEQQQQQQQQQQKTARPENGTSSGSSAVETVEAILEDVLVKAEETLHHADAAAESARRALASHRHRSSSSSSNTANGHHTNGGSKTASAAAAAANGCHDKGIDSLKDGSARHTTSSRELGGELGGDTVRM